MSSITTSYRLRLSDGNHEMRVCASVVGQRITAMEAGGLSVQSGLLASFQNGRTMELDRAPHTGARESSSRRVPGLRGERA